MEQRNREARRGGGAGGGAASALRRPRANGPKDASDEDERMDDAPDSRPWERPKKERIGSFHVSGSANSRNKRKRQGLQEAQAQGRSSACDDAEESAEETEIAASEDDDEPPPPPLHRRPGKSRGNGKGDEIVMDIRTVPRKARSAIASSSRFTSNSRRPQECLPADASQQQSPVPPQTSLNGISSSSLLGGKPGRRMKSTGTKIKAMKVPKLTEPTTISDQEVEVAEALFDLARSMPSQAGLLESKFEQKSETKLETEVGRPASPPLMPACSPPPVAIPTTSGPGSLVLQTPASSGDRHTPPQVQNVVVPAAEAPKRKRPRVVARQEEGRGATSSRMVASSGGSYSSSPSGVIHSPVGEAEQTTVSEKSQLIVDDGPSLQLESLKGKVAIDSPLPFPELHGIEDAKINGVEHQNEVQVETRNPEEKKQDNVNTTEVESGCFDSVALSPAHLKIEASPDFFLKDDGAAKPEVLSRPSEFFHDIDGNTAKLGIDLMVPQVKVSSKEEDAHDVPAAKQALPEDTSINVRSYPAEAAPYVKGEQLSHGHKDIEDLGVGVKNEAEEETGHTSEWAGIVNREQKKEHEEQMLGQQLKEEMTCQIKREGTKDREIERAKDSARIPATKIQKADPGTPLAPSFLPSTFSTDVSSSTPVALAGWMGPLGYYGSGAPPWPAGASLPRSNLDGKTAHPVMRLPHAAFLPPVPRMKRCTTHVYIAHYIYFEQQSRHPLWSGTICRGTPYNLNIPPMNIDKGKICGAYVDLAQKVATQQPGPAYGYTVPQSNGPGIPASSGSSGNSTIGNTVSAPSHSTGGGISVETGAGSASGSVANMTAHAQYFQAMMQQNGFAPFSFPFNGPPPGQGPQYFNSPFYPAHLVPPLPHLQSMTQQAPNLLPVQKQQQGSRTLPNSSSSQLLSPQHQQQLQLQLAPQSPSHSQQQQQQQQHNMGISTQHFGAHSDKDNVGGESHSTAESRLPAMQRRGKQTSKSQQQTHIQAQQAASLSPSMQQHQLQQFISQNSGPGSALQMKGPDPSVSQGFAPMNVPSMNRGSVGPGPLGLVPVAAVMAAQGHAMLPGSSESTKMHAQQQQSFMVHNQPYQRTMPTAAASVNEDIFVPISNKGRDFVEEKKPLVRQGGIPPLNLSRADIEVSSPGVQASSSSASSSSGSIAPTARLASNVGQTLNVAAATGTRNGRSAPSVGTGQMPHLQNQTLKQGMSRPKTISGTSIPSATTPSTIPLYVERASHPGNLGKISGTVLPFPGQMASCSQGSKQGQAGTVRVSQRTPQGLGISTSSGVSPQVVLTSPMSKSQGQQARNNHHGTSISATAPRMVPSVSGPVLSSGTLSLSTSNSLPVLKAAGVAASKSPSNGKGTVPVTKSGSVSGKRPPVSGPTVSSVISGQNMSAKAPLPQKIQGQLHPPHFSPQQSMIPGQQQQPGTKHQICHQQQPQQASSCKQSFPAQSQYRSHLFLPQHNQQYLQHSPSQQQALPQQTQQPPPHYFHQHLHNSPIQHGHSQQPHPYPQQQLHSVSSSSSAMTNNGLSLSSPNLTLGTGLPGNTGSTTNTDGADQFHGSDSRANLPKSASSPGNQLPSVGLTKNNMALLSSNAVVSGPQHSDSSRPQHSDSSHYLQLAPVPGVKPMDQKSLSDGVNWEERSSIRHLPSSSPSQPPLIANPTSS